MKKLITLLLFALSLQAQAQDYPTLKQTADAFGFEKAYAKAVDAYRAAFLLPHSNANDLYNAACNAALAGQKDQAFTWLQEAIALGMLSLNDFETDTDLDSLRTDPRWASLITDLKQKIAIKEKDYNKPLQQQLLKILNEDQLDRKKADEIEQKYGADSKEWKAIWAKIDQLDQANLVKIKAILKEYGWVGPSVVGYEANSALFLVIQHADHATQKLYLPMMQAAVKKKNANPSDLALLEDRIAIRDGKRQLYGSQLGRDKSGKFYLSPVADPDNLDARRAAIGLEPIAGYIKRWNLTWNLEQFKKEWDLEEQTQAAKK